MKKILFLLLSTIAMYGQVPADATPLENIQITNNTQSTTATKVNVQEANGTINTISKSDLVNVVEVNDVPSLPLIGEVGKIYVVKNVNKIYRWNGTFYQELAGSDISGKINLSEKGAINGVATLGSDGKVSNSQIPALAISETFPVSSQAQMLALSQADQGDVAIRSDISKSFILRVSPSSVLGNWSELLTPTGAVTSVAGKVGVVTLNTSDIGGLQTALDLKENTFTKNTAFNKNFGTTAGTVVEGNDSRILNGQTAFGWGNHAGLYPSLTGTGANGTWGINISGNSQTSSALGQYNWNQTVKDNADFMFGRNAANEIAIISQLGVRNFLNLGSNAYNSTAYLPLTGGTLTGGLNGTSANFTSSVTATSFNGSATLTGTPTAPTAAVGTNTTQVATTAFVLANASVTPNATTSVKGIVKLAGDLGGTADLPTVPALVTKANLASPSLTGTPTAPTATAGANTTQVATTAFVTNGIATADAGNVKLTGNQSITGTKTFNNFTSGTSVVANNTSTGTGLSAVNSSAGTGIYSNNQSTGKGIHSDNNSTGISIYSLNYQSGNGIVSNQGASGTGFNYVGQNNGANTFTVNKLGATTATSFINSTAPATNALLANGTTIALGSNAYSSTAYLPLSGGTVNGPVLFNSTTGGVVSFQTNSLPLALMTSSQNIIGGAASTTDFNTYVYGNNPYNIWTNNIKRVTVDGSGNVDFTGTVTASPATASNHLVTKAQLDASATSRPYKVYTALLSQSGTNAPVATVLENTLGTVNFTRSSNGVYLVNSSGLFTADKTFVIMGAGTNAAYTNAINLINSSTFSIVTKLSSTQSDADSANTKVAFEIRVYN